ncbi:MAG: calcium-transporting P-type ATPase, PMR1-type [bacterium]
MQKQIHQLSIEEVVNLLQTDEKAGLKEGEAERRLLLYGPNELREERRPHPFLLFLRQFTDPLVLVLLAAALVSLLTGEITDFSVIMAVLILNGIMGFLQEYRAERAVQELKKMATPYTRVIREGKIKEIPTTHLVPGDIFLVETGTIVPADGRLIEAINLQLNEASLSGESLPVEKNSEPIPDGDIPLTERSNIIFSGTVVTSGHGKAIAYATGMQTEMGKITHLIQVGEEKKTPLQKRMEELGKWLAIGALSICALILLIGILEGRDPRLMFLTAVSLAVAAIPEGLPIVITISLALGARRMAKRNALVRKLSAVETLGCVTHICSDKTGTLTQNKMFLEVIYLNDSLLKVSGTGYIPEGKFLFQEKEISPSSDSHLLLLLKAIALCNDAHLVKERGEWRIMGDPTEGALLVAAAKGGLLKEALEKNYPRVGEISFDSHRKRMSTIHKAPQGYFVFVKGALEGILSICDKVYKNGRIEELGEEAKGEILKMSEELARKGMRILGVAYKEIENVPPLPIKAEEVERELVFLGFVGIVDPPRPEAREAVLTCREAGIEPIMITGDQPATALAIAREVALQEEGNGFLTGRDLEKMSDEELAKKVGSTKVFARVSPEEKLRIVSLLKKKGFVIATTGDGVNDAPALKEADIGVAMGITGTDVAKETADMILLDDNFATIVSAVKEGRVIYDNIRKFIRYVLTTNLGEILTLLFSIMLNLPLPVLPIQILWINLLTDGLPAIALGVEPPEPEVMKRPPRDPKESIFSGGMFRHILLGGLWMSIWTLYLFLRYHQPENEELARTIAFTTLAFFQMANVLAVRSERQSVFSIGFFSNPQLMLAVLLTIILQLSVIYVPVLQKFFHTHPLSFSQLITCVGVSASIFFLIEIDKLIGRLKSKTLKK